MATIQSINRESVVDPAESRLEYRSPHLHGVLERAGLLTPLIIEAFAFAVANGGCVEKGFARKADVSYNVRPARLGLIGVNEFGLRDVEGIAAAILVCTEMEFDKSPSVKEIVALSRRPLSWLVNQPEGPSTIAVAVKGAELLDDCRHAHLREDRDMRWDLENVEEWLKWCPESYPRFNLLLLKWKSRIRN